MNIMNNLNNAKDYYSSFIRFKQEINSSMTKADSMFNALIDHDISEGDVGSANISSGYSVGYALDQGNILVKIFTKKNGNPIHYLSCALDELTLDSQVPIEDENGDVINTVSLSTLLQQVNDSYGMNSLMDAVTTRILNYGSVSIDYINSYKESMGQSGVANSDFISYMNDVANEDDQIDAYTWSQIITSWTSKVKESAEQAQTDPNAELVLDTNIMCMKNFIGSAFIDGMFTVLQTAGLLIMAASRILGLIVTAVGYMGSKIIDWLNTLKENVSSFTINTKAVSSLLDLPCCALSWDVSSIDSQSKFYELLRATQTSNGRVLCVHFLGSVFYSWIANGKLYLNGFIDCSNRAALANTNNYFQCISTLGPQGKMKIPNVFFGIFYKGLETSLSDLDNNNYSVTYSRDSFINAQDYNVAGQVARSIGSLSQLLQDFTPDLESTEDDCYTQYLLSDFGTVENVTTIDDAKMNIFVGAAKAVDYLDGSDYAAFANTLGFILSNEQFWGDPIYRLYHFLNNYEAYCTTYSVSTNRFENLLDYSVWTNDVDGVPTDRLVLWPQYTKDAVRNTILAVSLVAIAAATAYGVGKTAIRKLMERKQFDNMLTVKKARENYLADRSNENWLELRKASRKYNFKAKLFGWGTYDLANDWINDPGTATSNGDPESTNSLESFVKQIRSLITTDI